MTSAPGCEQSTSDIGAVMIGRVRAARAAGLAMLCYVTPSASVARLVTCSPS